MNMKKDHYIGFVVGVALIVSLVCTHLYTNNISLCMFLGEGVTGLFSIECSSKNETEANISNIIDKLGVTLKDGESLAVAQERTLEEAVDQIISFRSDTDGFTSSLEGVLAALQNGDSNDDIRLLFQQILVKYCSYSTANNPIQYCIGG
jgi:hypothetical protein